jgi:membrane protein
MKMLVRQARQLRLVITTGQPAREVMTGNLLFRVLKRAAIAWNDDGVPTLGASLAYYTVFSMAPVLLIAISMGSLLVGQDAARSGIVHEIRQTLGATTADALAAMLDNAYKAGGFAGITVLGLCVLLVGASGVFVELQGALNRIWKTEALPRSDNVVLHFLRNRLLSFTAVLGTGFLLLISLIVSSVLAALTDWLRSAALPGTALLWHGLSLLISFGLVTLMFALIFKLLPDVPVAWRDVWLGAVVTALLFTLGQHAIGIYLGQSSVASTYGAAGSLVVLLVWVYYSAQIVLFGAEITFAFATSCGSRQPDDSRSGRQLPSGVQTGATRRGVTVNN